jgi:hypothetical protein
MTLIRDVVRALSPDRPIMLLTRLVGCPRPTARSWATGHRRPPISVLKLLRELVQGRRTGLEGELDYEIRRREYEPKHRTGFNQIDPLTGFDKRNRKNGPSRERIVPSRPPDAVSGSAPREANLLECRALNLA